MALAAVLAAAAGILASASARADYPSTVLGDGPVAYFRLNETGVLPTLDQAANLGSLGALGTGLYSGTAIHPVAGALAGETTTAARFFGDNGRVAVPFDAATMGSGVFTIEAWVRPAVSPPPSGQSSLAAVLSCGKLTEPRTGWLIYQAAGGWNLRGYTGVGTGTSFNITGGPTPVVGTWYHLAATFDGSIARVYVNGAEAAVSGTVTTYAGNTEGVLSVGSRSDVAFPYAGDVDEVAYYTTALNAATIAAHYAAGTNTAPPTPYATVVGASSPAVYLRLNEPAYAPPVAVNSGTLGATVNGAYRYFSTTVPDLSSPTYPGFAADNRVLQPSGTNGIVAVPPLNLNANTVTLECWIKPNGAQPDYAGVFFHRGSAGGTATGIDFKGTTGQLGYHWSDQANTYGWDSGLIPADGVWNYVALAVTPTKATMYMYDGTTWSAAVNEVAHPVQAFADVTRLGADQDAARFFSGWIDEAAIYAKTLSEGQLRTHALAGFGDPSHSRPTFVNDPPILSPADTIYSTTPFSITADVYGEPPLAFQWQRNGAALPGETSATLSRAAATLADAGDYTVVVTNAYGSVVSSVVTVTVNSAVPPTIDVQPVSRQVYPGGTARFSVSASGTPPFAYQWKRAGADLPGATNAKLVVPNCTAAETGTYQVEVSNVAGKRSSATVNLALTTPTAGTYEALVAGMRPVAYWRLGETSGTRAFDYAGGYDGTYVNVAQGQSGAIPGEANGAAGFDGASAYVTTGEPLLNNRAQFTVMGWLKRGALHSGRGGYFGQNDLLEFGDASSGASIEAWIDASGGNIITAWPWPDDQWGFIVLTGDGTVSKLYLDGKLAGSLASTVSSYGTNGFSFNIGGGGIFNSPNVNMDYFNGWVDEVAVLDRALSVQEICALYLKGTAYAGLFEPSLRLIRGAGEQVLTNVNFEGADGGFTVETPGGSIEAAWFHDGVSWYSQGENTGFGNDNASYLISPPITVTKAGVVKLTFDHRHSFELDATVWDGGAVEVSINGGPWTYVPAAQFEQNGYTGVVASAPALLGKQAFTGNSAGHPAYLTSSCLLAGAQAGDTVSVRFVAAYDYGATGNLTPPGWQISRVQLSEGLGGAALATCPCSTLERKQGDIVSGTWVDLGSGSIVVRTTQTNQQYFRIKR